MMNGRLIVGQRFRVIGTKSPVHPEIRIGADLTEVLIEGDWHLKPVSGPVHLYPAPDGAAGQLAICAACQAKSPIIASVSFPFPSTKTTTWAETHRCQ